MYRVMIVDDDKWVLTDISIMFPFARYGFELVATCTSAEAAEREFARLLPDLLITDIVMGKRSGLDLLRTCKKLREDVVVVIISGHDDFAYARQAVNDGAFYYMLKPIDTDEVEPLLRRIAMHLSAGSADRKMGEEPFDRILHYIQENLSPSLSLGELAKAFGYNRSYLSELFAGRLGITFTDYKKMEQGLINPNVSAEDFFYAGDTFTVKDYDNFFMNGLMDDGSEFGYKVEVVSIDEGNDGPTACIRITAE